MGFDSYATGSASKIVNYAVIACVLISAMFGTSAYSRPKFSDEEIVSMSLLQMRAAIDDKLLSSTEIVAVYLKRIDENNRRNKNINAVITINEKALQQANDWDQLHAHDTGLNPSLAGIPFLAKDNFNTKGVLTTGGSVALGASVPDSNAFAVQKLLDQGAILLGKTNMSELAASYGWPGYSSMGGQTINPFNPLRVASGSSSGSAAAVAARFAPFALGTDTTASIRSPSSVTGTVGMRTTLGLVSRSGVIPSSLTADIVGAITRTVEDQAIVLDAIQGEDKEDSATGEIRRPKSPFAVALQDATFTGKRIAVVDNFDGLNPEVDEIKERSIRAMQGAGAQISHIRLPKEYEKLMDVVLNPVGLAEFRAQFDAYLDKLPAGQPKTFDDFMKVLDTLTEHGAQKINPRRYKALEESLKTKTTDSPQYIGILTNTIPKLRSQLTAILEEGEFDSLFFPTDSCPASVLPGKKDPQFVCKGYAYAASKIASATGFPEISVNGGKAVGNVPVGMSFLGRAGDDETVLRLAAAFERMPK